MKKSILFAAFAAMIVCSCGTAKKVNQAPTYSPQPTQVVPGNQAAQDQLNKKEIALNECQLAEMSEENFMRAATAMKSYDLNEAKVMAEEEARTLLATRIQTAVENATKSYNKNVSNNNSLSEGRIRERINKQFCDETVGGLHIVANKIYALPNGAIEYTVCYEMKKNKEDVIKNVLEEISRDKELELRFDQKKFEEEMADEMKAYKEKRNN